MSLKEGQELHSIEFPTDGELLVVGQDDVKSIVVEHENGQMAGVPWVRVTYENNTSTNYNVALLKCFTT